MSGHPGMGLADSLETRPSLTCDTLPNAVVLGQTVRAYYGDPTDKFDL